MGKEVAVQSVKNLIDKAINDLAQAIYLLSITYSPESPQVVASYYQMGNLVLERGDPGSHNKANRFFEKVSER